uniref:F-box domain-containing protein n=1 Tax=Ditylenchus dipsaci TaxID=166011 RepID=A0A915D5A0_9BILA
MNPFPIANEILHQVLAFSSRGNLYELAKVNQNFSSMISKCFSHSPYQIIVYMEFVNGECFIGASIGSSVRVVRGAELQQLLEIVEYQKYLRVGHTSIALTASLALADTQIFEPICHVWSGKTLECTFSNPSTYSHGVQDSLTSLARLTHEFVPGYIFLKLMLTETEYEDLPFNTPVLPVPRLADWLCESRNELKLRKLELFTAKCNQKELKETVELLKEVR